MFVLASDIIGKPIISLQNGYSVAVVDSLVIKPETLEIMALGCKDGNWRKTKAVLLVRDVREIMRDGVIIDSFEDIEDVGEIVRLKEVIEKKYELIGASVVTESKNKLGKVEDYTVETTSYKIQKLYLKQSMLKNLLLNNLMVDREQIVDVGPKQIVVRDATITSPALSPQAAPQEPA